MSGTDAGTLILLSLVLITILALGALLVMVRRLRAATARAEQAAADRQRAERAAREQRELAEALRDSAAALNSTLKLDEVFDRILDNVGRVLPHDAAYIMLIEQGVARIVRERGYTERGISAAGVHFEVESTANLKRMVETRQPDIIPDVRADPRWKVHPNNQWVAAYVGAPIIVEDNIIGFVGGMSAEAGAFSPVHAERLQAFADQAGIAIHNARLYEELYNYSSILEQAVSEATAELAQAVGRVRVILESSPDAILLIGGDGRIETANPAFYKLFGYREGVDLEPQALAAAADRDRLHEALRAAVGGGQLGRVEFTARRHDGSTFDADAAVAPISSPREPGALVCSIRDITVLKNVDRMKNSFISTAAHELRTPLTSILGFSEILLHRSMADERRQHYLQTIYDQSSHLAEIVDEMLDISRLEAGRGLQMDLEPVDLVALVDDVLQPFYVTATRHEIVFEAEPRLPRVPGDRFRLAQAVRNLISNAVKYSPGGGRVTVQVRGGRDCVEVRVQDEGIGIQPDLQDHVFEKFYRIEPPNTAIPGTGLGLSIAKLVVEAHGGAISLESEVGRGSTFLFTIPVEDRVTGGSD